MTTTVCSFHLVSCTVGESENSYVREIYTTSSCALKCFNSTPFSLYRLLVLLHPPVLLPLVPLATLTPSASFIYSSWNSFSLPALLLSFVLQVLPSIQLLFNLKILWTSIFSYTLILELILGSFSISDTFPISLFLLDKLKKLYCKILVLQSQYNSPWSLYSTCRRSAPLWSLTSSFANYLLFFCLGQPLLVFPHDCEVVSIFVICIDPDYSFAYRYSTSTESFTFRKPENFVKRSKNCVQNQFLDESAPHLTLSLTFLPPLGYALSY